MNNNIEIFLSQWLDNLRTLVWMLLELKHILHYNFRLITLLNSTNQSSISVSHNYQFNCLSVQINFVHLRFLGVAYVPKLFLLVKSYHKHEPNRDNHIFPGHTWKIFVYKPRVQDQQDQKILIIFYAQARASLSNTSNTPCATHPNRGKPKQLVMKQ